MKFKTSKIILIEGLPGSGKSTTAQFLAYQLQKNKINSRWFHEYDVSNPLFSSTVVEGESINDVDEFLQTILRKWEQLVAELLSGNEMYIIESYLMQSTVGYLFENNINKEKLLAFCKEVINIIEPLNPILIYFSTKDISKAITRLKIFRGEEWVREHVERDANLPYIVANNLSGFEGWVRMFGDLKDITDEIYQLFTYNKITIDYTSDDWELYQKTIVDYLAIDKHPQVTLPRDILEKYVGNYKSNKGKYICSIKLVENNLYLYNMFSYTVKLVPIEENQFVAISTPHIFYFEANSKGEITRMIHDGRAIYQGNIYEFQKI